MKKEDVKIGMHVKMEHNNSSSHDYTLGATYEITECSGNYFRATPITTSAKRTIDQFYASECSLVADSAKSREDQAKSIEENTIPELKATLESVTAELKKAEADVIRLKTFKSREEEAAHFIASVFASKGDKDAIMKAMAETGVISVFDVK